MSEEEFFFRHYSTKKTAHITSWQGTSLVLSFRDCSISPILLTSRDSFWFANWQTYRCRDALTIQVEVMTIMIAVFFVWWWHTVVVLVDGRKRWGQITPSPIQSLSFPFLFRLFVRRDRCFVHISIQFSFEKCCWDCCTTAPQQCFQRQGQSIFANILVRFLPVTSLFGLNQFSCNDGTVVNRRCERWNVNKVVSTRVTRVSLPFNWSGSNFESRDIKDLTAS